MNGYDYIIKLPNYVEVSVLKKAGIIVAISCIAVIVLSALAVLALYSVPFVRANECIVFVNKNGTENSEDSDWLSVSDLKSLQIVDDDVLGENTYIEISTKKRISSVSWGKISLSYDISAIARDWDTFEEIEMYQGKRTIHFTLSGTKWIVEGVD